MKDADLLSEFRRGNLRALTRLISQAEDGDEKLLEILSELYETVPKASVLGVTGPPGAGKSTLCNFFVRFLREKNLSVAVVAIDPVSPYSGGSLLGDRIRLSDHFNDPKVFIRSLSTRGKLGGLSLATRQIIHLIDAFGFDVILVETVGVGQSEVDIRKLADVAVLVLVPESGDSIQVQKAGILEIGDVFIVNKSDREGADTLARELEVMLHSTNRKETPVRLTRQQDEASVRQALTAILDYRDQHENLKKKRWDERRLDCQRELIERLVVKEVDKWITAQSNVASSKNPYAFALQFKKEHLSRSLFGEKNARR